MLTQTTDFTTAEGKYFRKLAASKPISGLIASELTKLPQPPAASSLANYLTCGRRPIEGSLPIELVQTESGHVFARNVAWCGSRYCPICAPRIASSLAWKRAERAAKAKAAGLGIAFTQFGVPRGGAGELHACLDNWRAAWSAWPSPSTLRAPWKSNGLGGWLGFDYNIEIDYEADSNMWHVHAHALVYKHSEWNQETLRYLVSRWPFPEPLSWAEVAEVPEAAARYSVKFENDNETILNLFGLAALGMRREVGEYLNAVQGKRLRETSRATTALLKLNAAEDDKTLFALAERQAGQVSEQLSVGDWLRRW